MNKKIYGNKYRGTKNFLRKRFHYKRQLKRFICILIILSLILVLKVINNKLTSNIIQIINKGINYEFSIKEDGKKILNYSKKLLELSGKTLEALNIKNKPMYSSPIEGAVYKPFGEVKHLDGSVNFNNGVDIIPKDEKEPIVIEKGIVSKIEDKNTKGYFVTIQHENMTTVYGYLIEVYLREGERVNIGDKIGTLGTNKDGNKYLHFEIWIDNVPVNPMEYIKFSKSI
ncbi:murein DD-endopeptidase MepM/ murein hydrolase activator NlpD [Keratinibaculum paraultunense]|uniref:Murein DD-endopeptidase MepM/ murein hydrolase activator NlpD n=1 Tax=Keratinibaculum paraultunense TaxID=1278232 RepID=A0A4R3L370_9FIRM|nr:M23 family metallopeptidase [Keratinibaculum paraultunense]QQY80427.1 M23 family metallopeptidase [Keratinibaculum paraultunense]TCS91143.1 murein DD-endopeptidase MepM/ murein hydrolase activator NlpD [Keratinibaculum paraultunense]